MFPILLTIGSFHIFSFSVFLILAWIVFSFTFWKLMRVHAIDEEHVFDLTFYATLSAFLVSRAGFVLFHRELFADDLLRVAALWIAPGLTLYGGLLGGLLTLVYLARSYKIRLGYVLDALALALPSALLLGNIGSLLDGSVVGKMTNVPWAINYVGNVGKRHPVQAYEMLALGVIIGIVLYLGGVGAKRKWPYGKIGVWFFLLYSISMFCLEFTKDSSVYWLSVSANQWILVGVFAESLGAFYVRGGGREMIRPALVDARARVKRVIGGVYEKFSKRSAG